MALALSMSAYAKQPEMRTEVLEDGVLFISDGNIGNSTVVLRGPGQYVTTLRFDAGTDPFIDARFVNGKPLADGLYKYELVSSPRKMAFAPADKRNEFSGITDPKNSPVSGSFRVVHGVVVDPYLEESDK